MIKIFRVKGKFKQEFGYQRFIKEFPAISKEQAIERVLSDVGSKHKVKRNLICIEEITEVVPEVKTQAG
ncbi:MAG: hypothetical protein APU95_04955 [Hadesarchaea archaeon YNP_N21]|jgi:large subunit ribosomal protein LX|nr:MAG: hypothetical protein APU95_04955 [Hadesarchaea archaeon YNP_N21]